jgi:hypothetical protein
MLGGQSGRRRRLGDDLHGKSADHTGWCTENEATPAGRGGEYMEAEVVEQSWLRKYEDDPDLMVRMLLVGYCYSIQSEQRLCEETHLNLAY